MSACSEEGDGEVRQVRQRFVRQRSRDLIRWRDQRLMCYCNIEFFLIFWIRPLLGGQGRISAHQRPQVQNQQSGMRV